MRVACYCRTATETQFDDSLVEQEKVCREWASANGHEVIEVISEVASGTDFSTPGKQRLFTLIRDRRIDAVAFTAIDRLTRSIPNMIDYDKMAAEFGVALINLEGRWPAAHELELHEYMRAIERNAAEHRWSH